MDTYFMNKKYQQELAVLLSKIKDPKLMDKFLEDILTPAEYEEVVTRWQIIKLLTQGMPQREIAANLKVSIAKITRGSRELRDKNGGFWKVLKKNK
jgi:TrpR family transcriptional regulator, trp operon repressor